MRVANPNYPNIRITNITPELKADIIDLAGGKSSFISDYIKGLVKDDKKRRRGEILPPSSFKKIA